MLTNKQTILVLGIVAAVIAFRNFNAGKRGADVDSIITTWIPAAAAGLGAWAYFKK